MRYAIWGTGLRAELVKKYIDLIPSMTMVYYVETSKTKEIHNGIKVIECQELDFHDFDILVIATSSYSEVISYIKEKKGLLENEIQNRVIVFERIWSSLSHLMPFFSCKTDDNLYIARSEDQVIMKSMVLNGKTYSQATIDAFFDLSRKYYGCLGKKYFLDIGANIGTTSIYVKKKYCQDLCVIAFELSKENYDMFRVNCIINEAEDIWVENIGLSNVNGEAYYHYDTENPGGTKIQEDGEEKTRKVDLRRLDYWIAEHSIEPCEIAYIWMDTEGAEPEIIEGAVQILHNNQIPLLQEFNPVQYKSRLKKYCENIGRAYSHFIDMREYIRGISCVREIRELEKYYEKRMQPEQIESTDLFFIP